MPFTKITRGKNKGKFRTPEGRIWTLKQVRTYYVTDGFKRPVLTPDQVKQRKLQKNKA